MKINVKIKIKMALLLFVIIIDYINALIKSSCCINYLALAKFRYRHYKRVRDGVGTP